MLGKAGRYVSTENGPSIASAASIKASPFAATKATLAAAGRSFSSRTEGFIFDLCVVCSSRRSREFASSLLTSKPPLLHVTCPGIRSSAARASRGSDLPEKRAVIARSAVTWRPRGARTVCNGIASSRRSSQRRLRTTALRHSPPLAPSPSSLHPIS
jgi:hypothetical protein